MELRRWITLISLVIALLITIASCTPAPEVVAFQGGEQQGVQGSVATQIPEALVQFFNGVVIALFTAGFIYALEKTGLDLRQYAIPLAGTVSTWIVTELQGYINTIPDFQDVYINLIFRILLALVPAAGLLRIFSKQPATLLEHSTGKSR